MSYARMNGFDSQVYIYHHYMGFIECCGCSLTEPEGSEDFGFFKANTAREILAHMDEHRAVGDLVPDRAYERIKEEYPNLDSAIEEFK
jgi:hypothetical protein